MLIVDNLFRLSVITFLDMVSCDFWAWPSTQNKLAEESKNNSFDSLLIAAVLMEVTFLFRRWSLLLLVVLVFMLVPNFDYVCATTAVMMIELLITIIRGQFNIMNPR